MSGKKVVAAALIVAAGVGIGALVTNASAQAQGIQIKLTSNPVRTVLLVDGQQIETPATIALKKGAHTISAVQQSQDLYVTWGFDSWQINGRTVSYSNTITVDIQGPMTITVQYTIAQSGRYPLQLT